MRFLALWCLCALLYVPSTFAADAPASYTKECASCHGADGRGKTSGSFKGNIADLRSKKVQDLSDDDLYETIARGAKHRDYPHAYLYRGLKEKDIRDLVKYIRSLALTGK